MYGSGFKSLCIGSERDPVQHNRMKRSLAGAFSNKALLEQEALIAECVDQFVWKMGQAGAGPEGLNVKQWYEMIVFDVLGEMAFGESFHCIENGEPVGLWKNFHSIWKLMLAVRETTLLAADDSRAPVLHHCDR